ncbi:MAG TPA: hypothetical protein VFI74_05675 [Candidatus Saccharimonadales bacterium]|nr:hypothetical protein [Candidatus Saccharimonadales bacterium]
MRFSPYSSERSQPPIIEEPLRHPGPVEMPDIDPVGITPPRNLFTELTLANTSEPARSTMRSRMVRSAAGGLVALGLVTGSSAFEAAPAAESSHIYNVANTGGDGVWLHRQPGLNNGPGDLILTMPEGATFYADCFAYGTPVGPRSNPVWLHGHDQQGNAGYFTDFYSSSHWGRSNTLQQQGLPICGESGPSEQQHFEQLPDQQVQRNPQPASVFYSPLKPPTGLRDITVAGDINRSIEEWSSGNCSPDKAVQGVPESVDTLAGWSIGRLGPIYFLARATEEQKKRIKNIILIDPGNTDSFKAREVLGVPVNKRCDDNFDINKLLANWILGDSSHRLTILSGRTTEEKQDDNDENSKSTFKGLWSSYLAQLWNVPQAENQVKICDYNYMEHEEIWRKLSWVVKERNMSCVPVNDYKLTQWHP